MNTKQRDTKQLTDMSSSEIDARIATKRALAMCRQGDLSDEVQDPTRRGLGTALLGGLGMATLASCLTGEDPDESGLGAVAQALNGTDIRWVDTVLGTTRNGDLAVTPARFRNSRDCEGMPRCW